MGPWKGVPTHEGMIMQRAFENVKLKHRFNMIEIQGYHGTSALAASEIMKHGFRISGTETEWLGKGVYFFVHGISSKPENQAVEWAEASPEPPLDELYKDVYVEQWGPYTGTTPPERLTDEQ